LLSFNFKKKKNQSNEIDIDNVPALITKVWGGMSKQKFNILKNNSSWLKICTKVCDDCYLKFTRVEIENSYIRQAKQ